MFGLRYIFFLKISVMREEERVLRQKLSDLEKAKKTLQNDVACRDRTIQQLRTVSSSFTSFTVTNLCTLQLSKPDIILISLSLLPSVPHSGTIIRQQVFADSPALPEGL